MGQPAARITDMQVCPMLTGPVPHVGGAIIGPGAPTVLILEMPAVRMTDMAICVGPPATILAPCAPTVLIMEMPGARMGDETDHGGAIVTGAFTVLVGEG